MSFAKRLLLQMLCCPPALDKGAVRRSLFIFKFIKYIVIINIDNFQIENRHVQETLGKKQGSKVIGIDYTKQSSNIKSRQETLKLGAAGDDPALLPWISMYTNKSWDFAQQILYPKHQFSDQQIHLSKQYIKDYFALISQSGFKNNVERLFTDFCERILLARKYIDKSPARFIPVPWVWFDKNFTSGFKGTLSWLKKVKQNRLLLKTKYENLSQLCTLYKSYSSQLSIHCYKTTEAQIKSLSDLQLTNLYYGCVAEAKNFNPSYLHRYYKT